VELDREVAVGVSNDADPNEPGDPDAGLLAQLPYRRRLGRFPYFDLAARELPEPSEEPARRATLDEPAARCVRQHHDRRPNVGATPGRRAPGENGRVVELPAGPAGERDGARLAVGLGREADGLSELHDGLGEGARGPVPEGPLQTDPHRLATHVPFLPGPPGGDPETVRLEGDRRRVEGEGGDRPRDVPPDAGQPFELGDRRGDPALRLGDELLGRGVQVARARVVSGALPHLQDPVERSRGQGRDIRERPEEPFVVGNGLRHAGLLQEDLRDPEMVGLAVAAPRQGATVLSEPAEQRRNERRRERGGRGCRTARRAPSRAGRIRRRHFASVRR
jgi:hypothetical protein